MDMNTKYECQHGQKIAELQQQVKDQTRARLMVDAELARARADRDGMISAWEQVHGKKSLGEVLAAHEPRDILYRYEQWIKKIPVGEEHQGNGSSVYNWHRTALRKLREIAHEPQEAQECGACDDRDSACSNQHGICSRHGGKPHEPFAAPVAWRLDAAMSEPVFFSGAENPTGMLSKRQGKWTPLFERPAHETNETRLARQCAECGKTISIDWEHSICTSCIREFQDLEPIASTDKGAATPTGECQHDWVTTGLGDYCRKCSKIE